MPGAIDRYGCVHVCYCCSRRLMFFCRSSRVYIRLARGEAKRSLKHPWSQRMAEGIFAMTQGLDTVDFACRASGQGEDSN